MRVRTPRLELVAVWPELARAAVDDRTQVAQLLDTTVPDSWPPEIMADVMDYFAQRLEADPKLRGWWAWYIILLGDPSTRTLIGTLGFNGYPDPEGTLLLGYSIATGYEGQGYATEAVGGLLNWAFKQPGVNQVIAETLPGHVASLRVMGKNGMTFLADRSQAGTLKYGIHKTRITP